MYTLLRYLISLIFLGRFPLNGNGGNCTGDHLYTNDPSISFPFLLTGGVGYVFKRANANRTCSYKGMLLYGVRCSRRGCTHVHQHRIVTEATFENASEAQACAQTIWDSIVEKATDERTQFIKMMETYEGLSKQDTCRHAHHFTTPFQIVDASVVEVHNEISFDPCDWETEYKGLVRIKRICPNCGKEFIREFCTGTYPANSEHVWSALESLVDLVKKSHACTNAPGTANTSGIENSNNNNERG